MRSRAHVAGRLIRISLRDAELIVDARHAANAAHRAEDAIDVVGRAASGKEDASRFAVHADGPGDAKPAELGADAITEALVALAFASAGEHRPRLVRVPDHLVAQVPPGGGHEIAGFVEQPRDFL